MTPGIGTLELSFDVLRNLEKLKIDLHLISLEDVIRHLLKCKPSFKDIVRSTIMGVLPFDVVALTFSFLDWTTMRSCNLVCKPFYRIIHGDMILKPLNEGGWVGLYFVGGIRPSETRAVQLSTLNDLTRFNPSFKTWSTMPPMKDERYHCGAVCLNRQLYVIGGRNNKVRLSSMERYDVLSRTWSSLPPMKSVRSAPAVAAFNGCIYVFGGYDGKVEHRTIEKFDPNTNQWTNDASVSRMPIEACEVSAVVLGSDIYIIGGTQSRYSQQENILAVCQKYDPVKDQWTVMSPMKHKRMCPAAVALDGRIVVIGGSNGVASLDVLEIYDPKTDTWTSAPPMNICRSNATACVFQGEIFVGGGFCSGALDTVEKFSPTIGQWKMVARMPTKRDACKLVAFE